MENKIIQNFKLLFIPCSENKCRPSFLESRFLFWCILALFFLKIILVSFVFCFPQNAFFAEINKATLFSLTNQERQSLGLNSLAENQKLKDAAYLKAQDMLRNDYFAHTSPAGISPWYWFGKAGYDYKYAGENLAIDFLDSGELYRAWDNSPSHRENIINSNYSDIGIAVVTGDFEGKETTVVVQLFGLPVPAPTPAPTPAPKPAEETPKPSPEKTSVETPKTAVPTSKKVPAATASGETGGKSLYSYYLEKGERFPSFRERAKFFEEYGLGSALLYQGSAAQNTALLNKIIGSEKPKVAQAPVSKEPKETKEPQKPKPIEPKKEIETPKPEEEPSKKELTEKEIAFLEKTKKDPANPVFPSGEVGGAKTESNGLKFKVLSFAAERYGDITQKIFLVVLAMVVISLCLDIFIRSDIQYKGLIFRGVFYTFALLALFALDEELIIGLIPHNLGIL